jgi:hypothetical protein
MVATIIECIKEKFAYISIDSLKNPTVIPSSPVSSYAGSQTSVIKAVFHRA